jgi:parallel beta-helix repeat protein
VHHNVGPGLWTDVDNINTVFEKNVVEDNTGTGIFHEISYDAIIRNNQVRRNGHSTCNWLYGAGILVAHSSNVEVHGNTVEDNCNGIVGIQQDRGAGPYGPHELKNLYVHDNTVRMPSGQSGIADGSGGNAVYTSRNNRFESNSYSIRLGEPAFGWMNQAMTKAQWQAAGQDKAGTFVGL